MLPVFAGEFPGNPGVENGGHGGVIQVQAGAGIVADSVPAAEYQETVNKAMAVVKAIEAVEKGLD